MAEFKSRYAELGFYINGKLRNFRAGRFVTEDAKEIEVLEKLTDAVRVDEPIKEVKTEEPAPAPKAPAKKTSGK